MPKALGPLAIGLAWLFSASAHGSELHAYLTKDEAQKRASIDYSECSGDEVPECISHSLSCGEFGSANFTVTVGPVERIAASLIIGTEGAAEGQLLLAGGWPTTLAINSIEVSSNELDGGWMLSLTIGNAEAVFEHWNNSSTEGAEIEVGGERFSLAPRPGDGAKLMDFKAACGGSQQPASYGDSSWTLYGNPRFGFWIDIPPGFSGIVESTNGDGGIAKSADGNAELSIWGSHLTEGNFKSEVRERIELTRSYGWNVTYEKRDETWASWSGTKGDRVMYERAIAICDSGSAFFLLEYDTADIAEFGPVIDHLLKSFKPGTTCN
ncbi:hypothetical protein ABMA32_13990 [Mesorhizobium sp. VNQ89]|uniref:hypothetical protein n=1 Tax=Mesorhizobium quangtriensis TaxID=3157709 RepID=UPI0032B85921